MNKLKRFFGQGVIAYAAFLLCKGLVDYIPYPKRKVYELMNYERKNYQRKREVN